MIYFIQAGDGGSIKIGTCRDGTFSRRLASLQTGAPDGFEILGVMDGDADAERHLHVKFNSHRHRGEWFTPAVEIIEFIRAHGRPFQVQRKSRPNSPIASAIDLLGGQTAAARALGLPPANVGMWKHRKNVPADKVLKIEELTGISRHVLRPDIFGAVEEARA